MATNSSQINVTDLDFDSISDNLKAYLKGQSQFKDYDFEGSNMSVLIDLLAYASHIGAVNTNIAASELFLDSAQMRKNVVSRAKDLGFIPASESASQATIDVACSKVINADGTYPTTATMQLLRGTIFQTVYDGTNYNYVVTSTVRPSQNGTTYNYTDVNLVQGTYATDTFVFDTQQANPKFVLSNARVDKSLTAVTVASGGITSTYALSTNISAITTNSRVYYTQENEEGFIEIYFGDGVLGASLKDGDTINVTYVVVDTEHADGANQFSMVGTIAGFSDIRTTRVVASTGGAEKESIDSIKFKATKFYTSQNRLVTLNDYKAKVSEYYPNADAVAVWGGEDNDPPQYGKVFIALKPKNSDYLSDTEKASVQTKLNKLNMLTVRPTIIDADIVKILISCVFKYNENATQYSNGELVTLVTSSINTFDNTNLANFDSVFRHSNLVKAIDETDSAILSNTCNLRLKKATTITIAKTLGYTSSFGNALYNPNSGYNAAGGGITLTTGFYTQGDTVNVHYFDDDGNGILRRYYVSSGARVYLDSSAGTVDYTNGKITINAINITSTVNTDSTIDFTVIPAGNDVVASRGNLIDIAPADVKVTGEVDTIASGESSAGVGYTSTSSSTY
jgi:hypothetical protein|tara:strand:- start:8221 stop:10092 length:1872 start_codon:yes stop_codon:yes gene_type:complete